VEEIWLAGDPVLNLLRRSPVRRLAWGIVARRGDAEDDSAADGLDVEKLPLRLLSY
jgi:hypothetical protein